MIFPYSAALKSAAGSPLIDISANQPAPYGSELTSSGLLTSASLTATTVPVTGEKISETDFVDSTSPQT